MDRGEESREVPRDAAFEGWNAGAHDTNVDFEGRPNCGKRVVPADIVADGDGVKSAEAHDGYNADDTAHAEDDHEDVSLALREIQRFEDW